MRVYMYLFTNSFLIASLYMSLKSMSPCEATIKRDMAILRNKLPQKL